MNLLAEKRKHFKTSNALWTWSTRMRLCLSTLYVDAKTRWPGIWTNGRGTKDNTTRCCIPAEVLRCSTESTVYRLFERMIKELQMHSGNRSTGSIRGAMSFYYGFLFGSPSSLVTDWESLGDEAMRTRLKNKSTEELVAGYHRYRESGDRLCKHAVSLSTLSRHMFLLNTLFQRILRSSTAATLTLEHFGITHGRRGTRRPRSDSSTATSVTRFSLQTVSDGAVYSMMDKWVTADGKDESGTHVFGASEVRSLYLACEQLIEKILFTALFSTGMRIGGFCRLQHPTETMFLPTVEKGPKNVRYRCSDVLKHLIDEWMSKNLHGPVYLLPDESHTNHPMPVRTARRIFMRVCNRASVHGKHVHPHTTRHTVIWTLWALGNPLEHIAEFAHHNCTTTTMKQYIKPTDEERSAAINIPWIQTGKPPRTVFERAQALSVALASPFGSKDGKTFPDLVFPEAEMSSSSSLVTGSTRTVRFQNPVELATPTCPDEASVSRVSIERAEKKAAKRAEKQNAKNRILAIYERVQQGPRPIRFEMSQLLKEVP